MFSEDPKLNDYIFQPFCSGEDIVCDFVNGKITMRKALLQKHGADKIVQYCWIEDIYDLMQLIAQDLKTCVFNAQFRKYDKKWKCIDLGVRLSGASATSTMLGLNLIDELFGFSNPNHKVESDLIIRSIKDEHLPK